MSNLLSPEFLRKLNNTTENDPNKILRDRVMHNVYILMNNPEYLSLDNQIIYYQECVDYLSRHTIDGTTIEQLSANALSASEQRSIISSIAEDERAQIASSILQNDKKIKSEIDMVDLSILNDTLEENKIKEKESLAALDAAEIAHQETVDLINLQAEMKRRNG